MSQNLSQAANNDIIAKSLQLKYNEVLRSFFKQSDVIFSKEMVDLDNEQLDLEKLLKYYYACPRQN